MALMGGMAAHYGRHGGSVHGRHGGSVWEAWWFRMVGMVAHYGRHGGSVVDGRHGGSVVARLTVVLQSRVRIRHLPALS